LSETTATFEVPFSPRPKAVAPIALPKPTARLPRLTRLLALAHKIDGMITAGEVRDMADAARLAGVTRARMSQIGNLLLLSPTIQEELLTLPPGSTLSERSLRPLVACADWRSQHELWKAMGGSIAIRSTR
jgi:hypothetical protein